MEKIDARWFTLILAIVCVPFNASADKLDECLDKANTQRAMEHCAHAALEEVQRNLEILYRGHLGDLEKQQREAASPEAAEGPRRTYRFLRESQDVWAKYLAANCNLHVANVWEGTMMTLARELCYVRMTKERIQDITRAFEPP